MKDFGPFGGPIPATTVVAPSNPSAVGTSLDYARGDHNHGLNAALTNVNDTLTADVTMTNANQFYDGPSVTVGTAGVEATWLVLGTVTVEPVLDAQVTGKIHDGTNRASAEVRILGARAGFIALSTIVTVTGVVTFVFKVACNVANATILRTAPINSAGPTASQINAIKIA